MENAFIKSPYGGMKSNFAFIYKSKQKKNRYSPKSTSTAVL